MLQDYRDLSMQFDHELTGSGESIVRRRSNETSVETNIGTFESLCLEQKLTDSIRLLRDVSIIFNPLLPRQGMSNVSTTNFI